MYKILNLLMIQRLTSQWNVFNLLLPAYKIIIFFTNHRLASQKLISNLL